MTKQARQTVGTLTTKQRSIALFIVALAFVMDLLDATIVNIAIPSIQANLNASFANIQWLVAGYILTFAVLLITGGRMGDVFGYKKMFLFGISGFTIASLLCGLAGTPEVLVGARLLQGAMAAIMVPQVMSLMQVMYKHNERTKVMGLFGMLGGLAATLGPIVGGLLIQANLFGLDWRPIFLINVPVGIAAIIAGIKFLPDGKSPHPLRLDGVGTVILIVALSLLMFPLIQGRELGWPAWTIGMLIAFVPVFVLFLWYERFKDKKDGSALVELSLFRLRSFVSGLSVNTIVNLSMLGFFLTFTIVLQAGLGFSVIKAALVGIPTAVGIGLSIAIVGQKLVPLLGRYTVTLGAGVAALGFVITTAVIRQLGFGLSGWELIPGLFITGLGFGTIMGSMFSVTLQDVDIKHAGAASGVLSASQQIGGAVGVAIVGAIFFGHISSGAAQAFQDFTPRLEKDLAQLQVPAQAQPQIIDSAKQCFVDRVVQKDHSQLPASCQFQTPTDETSQQVVRAVEDAVKRANTRNFITAYVWSMVFALSALVVTAGLSLFLPRHFKTAPAPTA